MEEVCVREPFLLTIPTYVHVELGHHLSAASSPNPTLHVVDQHTYAHNIRVFTACVPNSRAKSRSSLCLFLINDDGSS